MNPKYTTQGEDDYQRFCRALGEALRENEDAVPSSHELALEAYEQLCHDQPLLSSQACQALASSLGATLKRRKFSEAPTLALSEPLVQGIRQLLQQPEVTENTSDDKTNKESTSAFVSSRALLACKVFLDVPYQCLLQDDPDLCRKLLGSYQGCAAATRGENDDKRDVEALVARLSQTAHTQDEDAMSSAPSPRAVDVSLPPSAQPINHDNLQCNDANIIDDEVWAAESDPSDFEFESGYDPQQALHELDDWAPLPLELSKANSDRTVHDLAQATVSLLQQLEYRHLVGLGVQWQQHKVTETLSTLVLMLAVPSGQLLDQVAKASSLAQRPLLVLRDAALDQPARHLATYLKVLRQLFQVQRSERSSCTPIAPASWMGLSGWAQLGTSALVQRKHLECLREALVASTDDLALILEDSLQASDSSINNLLPWNLLPVVNVLVHDDAPSPLTTQQAQKLLSSGFLREFIRLYESQARKNNETSFDVLRDELLRELLRLALQNPSLLGKYIWRYPGLASAGKFSATSVARLLWNVLGAGQQHDAPRVQWKNKAGGAGPPALSECQESVQSEFELLIDEMATMLEYCINRLDDSVEECAFERKQALIDDWNRLATSLSSSSWVLQSLVACLQKEDANTMLVPIQKLLLKYASRRATIDQGGLAFAAKAKEEDGDEQQNPHDHLHEDKKRQEQDSLVHQVRKSLKIIAEALRSSGDGAGARSSSKAD